MSVSVSDAPIRFPCHCGYRFNLEADRAGSTTQCPKCGLLVDVPNFSDLQNLADDGTLRLKDAPVKPEPRRIAVVDRHFGPSRVDRDGKEIDLRNTYEDLANVGAAPEPDQIPTGSEDKRPAKPKYDPITGELVRPVPLAKRPDLEEAHNAPVAARALTYATGEAAFSMNARKILGLMLMPTNVVVMLFIFLFYFLFQLPGLLGMTILSAAGLMPTLYMIPLGAVLMAHYVNTLEDNAIDGFDELPRPLRNLSFVDDFWRPFVNMAVALGVCFLPALVVSNLLPPRLAMLSVLPVALGFFFFPAALLTTGTAGTLLNLRIDRLAGVVRVAAGDYVVSFFAWSIALPLFIFTLFGVYVIPAQIREDHLWIYKLHKPAVELPLLFVTIYLMHFASWHLGLIYRRHHEHFPWILQKHVSKRREEEAKKAAQVRAMRRKPRYVKQSE